MKRLNSQAFKISSNRRADTALHLFCGIVGVGKGEDFIRTSVAFLESGGAIRRVRTVVLPVPAPATTSMGPWTWSMASRWRSSGSKAGTIGMGFEEATRQENNRET